MNQTIKFDDVYIYESFFAIDTFLNEKKLFGLNSATFQLIFEEFFVTNFCLSYLLLIKHIS